MSFFLFLTMALTITGPTAMALSNHMNVPCYAMDATDEGELPFQEDENEESKREVQENELEQFVAIFNTLDCPLSVNVLFSKNAFKNFFCAIPCFEVSTPPPKA